MSIVGNIIKPIVGNIVGGIVGGAVADPYANLAWSAGLSEYQRSGANTTDADFELSAQIDGVGTPVFTTPAGLLLPTSTAGLWYALANANDIPVYGARWAGGTPYTNDGVGSTTPLATMPSLFAQPAATNSALYSHDATNAVWTASNLTTALDATGIDGVASNASTLTATAANATLLQTVTAASAEHAGKFVLRRKTGTGNVDITLDGGTTWTTVTLTTTYQEFETSLTVTNPQFGIRIVASGDAVEMGNVGLRLNKTAAAIGGSPPIFTTTVAVAQAAITIAYDVLNHADNQGAYYCEYTQLSAGNDGILSVGGSGTMMYINGALARSWDGTNGALNATSIGIGTTYKIGVPYSATEGKANINVSGSIPSDKSYDGVWNNTGGLYVLGSGVGTAIRANTAALIRNIRRYDLPYAEAKAKIAELML